MTCGGLKWVVGLFKYHSIKMMEIKRCVRCWGVSLCVFELIGMCVYIFINKQVLNL